MTFNPFSVLTSKIFAGLSLALLLVCVGLLIRGNHYRGQRDAARTELAAVIDAGKRAHAAQLAENKRVSDAYKGAADNAERNHGESRVLVRDATDRYSAAHRVRSCPSSPGNGDPAPKAGDPPVHADAADPILVAVPERDLRLAGDNYAYARSCYDWGQMLIAKGLAEPK